MIKNGCVENEKAKFKAKLFLIKGT